MNINLIANYLGQFWVTLIGIIFIPIYLNILGPESIGLIGFFGLLTVWFSLLDMGLTPVIARQMSSFIGGGINLFKIKSILRTVEFIFIFIAILISIVVYLSSDWLSANFVNAELLSTQTIQKSVALMGIVIGLRFIENIYRSSLIGLDRHVLYNTIASIMATLRAVGAFYVLSFYEQSIVTYFWWQCLISLVLVFCLFLATYSSLRGKTKKIIFKISILNEVKDFAGGMFLISLLTLAMTQIDKIILIKLISLKEFGWYSLAAIVSGSIYMAATPITQTFFPRMVALFVQNNNIEIKRIFLLGSSILAVVIGTISFTIINYADTLLNIWTGDPNITENIVILVIVLTLGNYFNTLMYMPYQLALSQGITRITVIANSLSLISLATAFLYFVPLYGAIGAASVYLIYNFIYLLIVSAVIFKVINYSIFWEWLIYSCLIPSFIIYFSILISSLLLDSEWNILSKIIYISIMGTLALILSSISSSELRSKFISYLHSFNIKITKN